MKKEQSSISSSGGWFARFYLLIALLVVPAFGLYEGLVYLTDNQRKIEKNVAARELVTIGNQLRLHADEQGFWVNRLNTMFSEGVSAEGFNDALRDFAEKIGSRAEYAIYDSQGAIIYDNFIASAPDSELWKSSGTELARVLALTDLPDRDRAIDRLRQLLGRNFFLPALGNKRQRTAGQLFPTDFLHEKFRIWLGKTDKMMALVKVPVAELKTEKGLRYYFRIYKSTHLGFAHFKNSQLASANFSQLQAKVAFSLLQQTTGKDSIELEDSLYCRVQIGEKAWIVVQYRLQKPMLKPGRVTMAFLLLAAGFIIMLHGGGSGRARIEDLSLLLQIGLLLTISAGIPLAILVSVAFDYFNNKQLALIREKNQEMIEFVQRVDQSLQAEYARYVRAIAKAVDEERTGEPGSFLPEKIFKSIVGGLVKSFSNLHLVTGRGKGDPAIDGSKGVQVFSANYDGILADRNDPERINVELLADQHLAALNSFPPKEVAADRTYVVEMIFQKPVDMVLHDLVKDEGTMSEAGWGSVKFLLFTEAFRSCKDIFDFYLMASFDVNLLQEKFIDRQMAALERNQSGFKIFVARERFLLKSGRHDLYAIPELYDLFLRVVDSPLPDPEILEFNGERQLFVGLKGRRAYKLSFCVLFPLAGIEREINREASDLFYLALLAIVLIFLMIIILYLNLLMPVNRLHQAAVALENRDDSFRLPVSGNDEFAEMATIFNASIADFEELKIASIVQTRLLPVRPLQVAGYSIFGHCLPMIELGGDYFDYFQVDDDHFALLLGDVAGHGVGASLIMAMAKAGVICGKDVHKDPAALLGRLHQIILAIKNRVQRKVMTFQYLLVERSSGGLTYANAGGCSPVIYDPATGKIQEINHTGAVLGGFKKNVYTNIQLGVSAGQAMIFYTDGMVESRNPSGVELGYHGLYEIIAACYDPDAAKYYERIMTAWRRWLGSADAGDDITMIVMVCVP